MIQLFYINEGRKQIKTKYHQCSFLKFRLIKVKWYPLKTNKIKKNRKIGRHLYEIKDENLRGKIAQILKNCELY